MLCMLPAGMQAGTPGVEGSHEGGVPQEDGQEDHDLDDVHEVVAHREARHQGDEGVLGVYLAGVLGILLGLEICLHAQPGCHHINEPNTDFRGGESGSLMLRVDMLLGKVCQVLSRLGKKVRHGRPTCLH